MAGQFLDRRQLNALGSVIDCFLVRPAGGGNTPAQLREFGFRGVKMEGVYVCFYWSVAHNVKVPGREVIRRANF
ncbi:hypothetical protein D3C84_1221140 [compost metagenome]